MYKELKKLAEEPRLREQLDLPTCPEDERPPRRRRMRKTVAGINDNDTLTEEEMLRLIALYQRINAVPNE